MTIFVSSATADGVDLQAGDEIGIFDGDLCVAAGVLKGVINTGNFFKWQLQLIIPLLPVL